MKTYIFFVTLLTCNVEVTAATKQAAVSQVLHQTGLTYDDYAVRKAVICIDVRPVVQS